MSTETETTETETTETETSRPARMFAALVASENKRARMELTVTVAPLDGGTPLHRTYAIRKWTPSNGGTGRLFVSLPETADWDAGIRPATPLSVNLETGQIVAGTNDPRNTALLIYGARAALTYAKTGEAPTPKNGTVAVVESTLCGACGRKLTDPVSIERGIGPECFGKATGSKTIKLGAAPAAPADYAVAA